MNLKELFAAQDTAGKKYRKAIDELHAAYIELGGIENALLNANVNTTHIVVPTFALVQNSSPFHHPVFAPIPAGTDWSIEVAAERDRLIAEFSSEATTPTAARRIA